MPRSILLTVALYALLQTSAASPLDSIGQKRDLGQHPQLALRSTDAVPASLMGSPFSDTTLSFRRQSNDDDDDDDDIFTTTTTTSSSSTASTTMSTQSASFDDDDDDDDDDAVSSRSISARTTFTTTATRSAVTSATTTSGSDDDDDASSRISRATSFTRPSQSFTMPTATPSRSGSEDDDDDIRRNSSSTPSATGGPATYTGAAIARSEIKLIPILVGMALPALL